jgi:integrase
MILMRCGLRVTDALRLRADWLVTDADGAPYLRYVNHKMKRDALVPIDEQLRDLIAEHRQHTTERWPAGTPGLFPRPTKNIDGTHSIASPTYRMALLRWLVTCDVRDEHNRPVHLTPHQWRHTLGTRLDLRGIASDASFGSRGERCSSGDLGVRWRRRCRSGCHSTRLLSCVDARHHTSRMHWVQR